MNSATRAAYQRAAANLSMGRDLRLQGQIEAASKREARGESYLPLAVVDSLMTSWENSLDRHPIGLEDWRKACGYSLEDYAKYLSEGKGQAEFEACLTSLLQTR